MPATRVSPCVNMDPEQKTERMFELEMRYKQAVHQTDLLVREEDGRRMKLRSMVLRDDNSSLKDQVAHRDNRIKILIQRADDARHLIESIQQQCARQEKQIQAQMREIAHLKEEIAAFSTVSQDSAKILSEKLALTREVAVLKPEIEHLKSQLSHQKDVLAEKLALERQLNTLEVELANEKRAAEKAAQKQERYTKEGEELRKQVRELEKELDKERKSVQRSGDSQQQVKALREQLATAEKKFASEKSKMEQATRAQVEKSTEMEEELDQLREKLSETEKALAAEKRAAQRKAKNQENKASVSEDELAALQSQIDELKQALAEEKKDKERLRKENQQAITEAEVRQAATDEKLDKFRTKLHEAKEELKKSKADLEKAREKAAKAALVTTTMIPTKKAAAKVAGKKRRADEVLLEETALGTPGAADRPKRPIKKRGFDPSDMVQKSTFSITPFLNKTLNPDGTTNEDASAPGEGAAESEAAPKPTPAPAEDSLMELGDDSVLAHLRPTGNTPTEAKVTEQIEKAGGGTLEAEAGEENNSKPEEKAKKGRGKVKALKPLAASVASKKGPIKVPKLKINKVARAADAVSEKPTEENGESSTQPQPETSKPAPNKPELKPKTKPSSAPTSESEQQQQQQPTTSQQAAPLQKKKKRKLLGHTSKTTLFDNDDEGERVDTSILPGKGKVAAAVTGKVTAKRVVAPLEKTMVGKVHIAGGSKNPFGKADKFSPLKKDRRGVNASFLH
ncbi:hypothetical protein QR685DRAFT_527837 [Neurospora intermedia]|uniref:Uncharacterized protein n=1 Tax=Neurospora intermedia TaxID=5142 RepID=A0ABR3DB29_NEUIN